MTTAVLVVLTRKQKTRIRVRDRRRAGRPKGFEIHHLWYSQKYNRRSFVFVTPEEHHLIHGITKRR